LKPAGNLPGKIILDVDTRYSRVWIENGTDEATGRPARFMTNSIYGIQSGMFLDDPDELIFPYTKLFDLAAKLNPDFKTVLMIGAGAYSYPKHFVKTFPKATLDVVEIDPKLTELAKEYFNFKANSRVAVTHEDGRIFLNRNDKRYDIILNDAFLSYLNIPFQLTTEEAVQKMSDALSEKGIVMTNLVGSISGLSTGFLEAEYATYKKVFPAAYLIKVTDKPDEAVQNVMLVAMKSLNAKLPLASVLKNDFSIQAKNILTPKANPNVQILTDEFAPIEKYTAKMLL
jgi:spermidine synthase